MPDQGGMGGCASVRFSGSAKQRRHEFAKRIPNADPLKIRKTDDAVLTPAGAPGVRKMDHGGECDGTIVDACDEASRRGMKGAARLERRTDQSMRQPDRE